MCKNVKNSRTFLTFPRFTSDDELSREVSGVSSVGGDTRVASTVSCLQAEEEDVAAEDIILDLNILASLEIFPVFMPLNVDGHVAGGYGAGDLRSVSLRQISIKCEGRDFRRFYRLQSHMTGGAVPLLVEDGAGVELAVRLLHRLQHEGAVAEDLRPGPGDQPVVETPLGLTHWVARHRTEQEDVSPHHGRHVDQTSAHWLPCKHHLCSLVFISVGLLPA